MLYGILGAICSSLSDVFYKKALILTEDIISDRFYQLVALISLFSVLIFSLLVFDLQIIPIIGLGLVVLGSILSIISEFLEQYAFRNEKLSILTPYGEFETVFTVLFGFLIFDNNTLGSFIFACLAGILLIGGGIDFQKFGFNKFCLAFTFSGFLTAIKFILYGYLLFMVSAFSALFYTIGVSLLFMVLLVVFFREFYYAKKLTTKMAVHIFFENIFWLAATFITLYLVKELGIVQAVLVGMLYLGFNLLLSFLVFSDIPRKRDVLVVIGVFFCVVFGTY